MTGDVTSRQIVPKSPACPEGLFLMDGIEGLRDVYKRQDFGLSYEGWKPPGKAKKPKPRQNPPEEQFQEAKNRCFRILADYLHLLRAWRKDYACLLYTSRCV